MDLAVTATGARAPVEIGNAGPSNGGCPDAAVAPTVGRGCDWCCITPDEIEAADRRLDANGVTLDDTLRFCWDVEDEGSMRDAVALSIAGARRAEIAHRPDVILDLRANAVRMLHSLGDLRGAITYGRRSLTWLRHTEDVLPKVRLLASLGFAYAGLDQIDQAIDCHRRAQALPLSSSPEAAYLLTSKIGETLQLFGQQADAAAEFRKAVAILRRVPSSGVGPYRQVYARLALAQSLLLAAVQEGKAIDETEVRALLDGAAHHIDSVPVLSAAYLAARGLAMAVTGERDADWLEAFLALPTEFTVREEGPVQSTVCAWATLEAVNHERLSAARSLLDKIDPADAPVEWPSWAASWHRAYAEVHAAEGNHAAAVESYRNFAAVDRRNRDRQVAMAFEMANRASKAGEIRNRQKEASSRAERLARRNAALAAEKAQLTETAFTDALTGIGNRRALELRVAGLRARRRPTTCTLVIGDVDRFKTINDTFTHQIGDKVLAVIGSILAGSVREQDCTVRWGGEEFVLLYHNPVALRRIDAVRRAVEAWNWSALDPDLSVTISFGAALWTTSTDFASALAVADERLYAAKRAGRNRVVMA